MKKLLLSTLLLTFLSVSFAKNTGFLGVTISDYTSNETNGVQITDLFENGAAKKFGLKENDIITAVNSVAVLKKTDLVTQVANYDLGNEITLSYVRSGVTNSIKVTLGKKPEAIKFKLERIVKADGEHWIFADDRTDILVKDKSPISIAKTDETGKTTVATLSNLPSAKQLYFGLEDKLQAIKNIKKEREKCDCGCPIKEYTLYKITPDVAAPIEIKTPISTELIVEKFTIAPNPSNGKITVDFASNEKGTPMLTVFDISGRIVQTEIIQNFTGEFSKQFNLENEAKGAYLIQLKIGDKQTNKKIILQ